MRNLVVLMEPSVSSWNISMKGADMMLNRFCIDEDASFELSGVNHLIKLCEDINWSENKKGRSFQ